VTRRVAIGAAGVGSPAIEGRGSGAGAAAAQRLKEAHQAPAQANAARVASYLGVKEKVRGDWKTMYCVLQKSILSMYPTAEHSEGGRQPLRTVS
jgi:hypothetical protein